MRSSTSIGLEPSSTSTSTTKILSTLLLTVLLSTPAVNAQLQSPQQQYTNDFSMYPQSARVCLQKAADNSTCTGKTHAEINSCLCPGTDVTSFPVRAAICIGRASPGDLWAVYALMKADCEDSKTPLAFSRGRFMQTAFDASTTFSGSNDNNSPPSPSDYKTPTPTKGVALSAESAGTSQGNGSQTSNASGLTIMTKTGIIIACVVVGSILGAIITYCLLLRRKKNSNAGMQDLEKRPMFSNGGFKPRSNTAVSTSSTLVSPHEWRLMDQSAIRSPSMPGSSIRGTPYLGAPSPMTPQGQWVLDPATGVYVLAGAVPPLPTPPLPNPQAPRPLQSMVPPVPALPPVEAPGVDVPVEMPSYPSTVQDWGRQPQTNAQFMHTAHRPYPIRTSLFPQNNQNSQGGVEGNSPSSVYSQRMMAPVQQTPSAPKRQYSLRKMFPSRQPSKNMPTWI